ncbi:hypothetical protein M758_UG300900 [Ceratodon purpureus]|nr:hypothetical protein M758_UG300900 [Ceratodon purpureus]
MTVPSLLERRLLIPHHLVCCSSNKARHRNCINSFGNTGSSSLKMTCYGNISKVHFSGSSNPVTPLILSVLCLHW